MIVQSTHFMEWSQRGVLVLIQRDTWGTSRLRISKVLSMSENHDEEDIYIYIYIQLFLYTANH